MKRLPSGISNYKFLKNEDYLYIDKTHYIQKLEQESNPYQFFIRPRKFGKSLFISTLSCYYDINEADQFDALFKDTYIGEHPTKKRNRFALLSFNFSSLDTYSETSFIQSFENSIRQSILSFLRNYKDHLVDIDAIVRDLEQNKEPLSYLRGIYEIAKFCSLPLFVIIDEYDHFANDLIALGKDEVYKKTIHANGVVRDFYEMLKIGTSTILERIFITGISPVMLDDLTSGFNIAVNLTVKQVYNEMMGFTQTEVDQIIEYTEVENQLVNQQLIKNYYNGYLFNKQATERIYNPSMLFYYLSTLIETGKEPESLYDDNLKTDYGRLRRLVVHKENKLKLEEIIKNDGIHADIISKFSIDSLGDTEYFVSLLFYMGLLTIDSVTEGVLRLKIPNYTIKTVYWEYLMKMLSEDNAIQIDYALLKSAIHILAFKGDPSSYIHYVSQNILKRLSNRDLQRFDEKYLKIILLSGLFLSNIYYPISESETENGYTDIYLRHNSAIPNVKYEWLFELKYIKVSDRVQLPQMRIKAQAQLARYANAQARSVGCVLRTAVLLFIGKSKVEIILNETK